MAELDTIRLSSINTVIVGWVEVSSLSSPYLRIRVFIRTFRSSRSTIEETTPHARFLMLSSNFNSLQICCNSMYIQIL